MSLAAVGALVVMIFTTVLIFGTDATGGPLQVALFTSTIIVGLLALRLGHRYSTITDTVVGGVSSAMGAIFIPMARSGVLRGRWLLSGGLFYAVYLVIVLAVIAGVLG